MHQTKGTTRSNLEGYYSERIGQQVYCHMDANEQAWVGQLYRTHAAYTRKVITKLMAPCWDRPLLEDIFSDTWLQVAKSPSHYRSLTCHPHTWLWSCCKSIISQYWLKVHRRPQLCPVSEYPSVPTQSHIESSEALKRALYQTLKAIPTNKVDPVAYTRDLLAGYTGIEACTHQNVSVPCGEKLRAKIKDAVLYLIRE
jgi:DNA-directed RNA polymerase specialized sigma24 family protein